MQHELAIGESPTYNHPYILFGDVRVLLAAPSLCSKLRSIGTDAAVESVVVYDLERLEQLYE